MANYREHDPRAGQIDQDIARYRNDPEYIADSWALAIAEEVVAELRRRGKSQTWLADRMGVSRSHVSSILNAPPNMTLLTLAKLSVALGLPAIAGLVPVSARPAGHAPTLPTDPASATINPKQRRRRVSGNATHSEPGTVRAGA